MTATQEDPFVTTLASYIFSEARDNDGKAPSERELAEHFSVSRGQIREALAMLDAMKVIERRAKSGIYVVSGDVGLQTMAFRVQAGVPLEPTQIYEAVEVRKIHEIKAAELAAIRAKPENLDNIARILDDSEQRIQEGLGLDALDREFHLEIVRATQNSLFYNICSNFYTLSGNRLSVYFRDAQRNRKSHEEHKQIFTALKNQDPMLASALMNAHLGGAMSYWTELLEGRSGIADQAIANR